MSFTSGTTAVIPVFAYSTDTSVPQRLDGYDLGFDISPTGVGVNSAFSNFTADFTSAPLNTNTYIDVSDATYNNFDIAVGAFKSPGVELQSFSSSNPLKLFDLQFQISPAVAPGTYAFQFVPGANAGAGNFAINNLAGTNGVGSLAMVGAGGQFTVAAVPEPMTLGCIGLCGVGACNWIRSRRKRSKRLAA